MKLISLTVISYFFLAGRCALLQSPGSSQTLLGDLGTQAGSLSSWTANVKTFLVFQYETTQIKEVLYGSKPQTHKDRLTTSGTDVIEHITFFVL